MPKQALPVADLSKITVGQTEVGGLAQNLAWDPKGLHLAVIFRHSSAVAVFLTSIKRNMLGCSPDFFLVGVGAEVPAYIAFQETYRNKPESVLTIGWSSGRVQYFPFN